MAMLPTHTLLVCLFPRPLNCVCFRKYISPFFVRERVVIIILTCTLQAHKIVALIFVSVSCICMPWEEVEHAVFLSVDIEIRQKICSSCRKLQSSGRLGDSGGGMGI